MTVRQKIIARIPTRDPDEWLIVALYSFDDERGCVDVRRYFDPGDGEMWEDTKKGVSVALSSLGDLIDALSEALAGARYVGLIPPPEPTAPPRFKRGRAVH